MSTSALPSKRAPSESKPSSTLPGGASPVDNAAGGKRDVGQRCGERRIDRRVGKRHRAVSDLCLGDAQRPRRRAPSRPSRQRSAWAPAREPMAARTRAHRPADGADRRSARRRRCGRAPTVCASASSFADRRFDLDAADTSGVPSLRVSANRSTRAVPLSFSVFGTFFSVDERELEARRQRAVLDLGRDAAAARTRCSARAAAHRNSDRATLP